MIYLDYAATSPMSEIALDALMKASREFYANPAAGHKLGKAMQAQLEKCRQCFNDIFSVGEKGTVVFTGSATEANNQILHQFIKGQGTIHLSRADHPSIANTASWFRPERMRFYQQAGGTFSPAEILAEIENCDVAVMCLVNNTSGIRQNVEDMARLIKEANPQAWVHIDAVQGFMKVDCDYTCPWVDSWSLAAHKIGGPKGVGALVLKNTKNIKSFLKGGGQEGGLRSSTVPLPAIYSFTAQVEDLRATSQALIKEADKKSDFLKNFLNQQKGIEVLFDGQNKSPFIISILTKGVSSDIVMRHLGEKEVMVSTSSACSSRVKGDSAVLTAMKLDSSLHKNLLRISFGYQTPLSELETFCEVFADVWEDLSFLL